MFVHGWGFCVHVELSLVHHYRHPVVSLSWTNYTQQNNNNKAFALKKHTKQCIFYFSCRLQTIFIWGNKLLFSVSCVLTPLCSSLSVSLSACVSALCPLFVSSKDSRRPSAITRALSLLWMGTGWGGWSRLMTEGGCKSEAESVLGPQRMG